MARKLGLKRSLAALFLGLGLAGAASAQHPFPGPGYPAQDPRSTARSSLESSDIRTVEFGYWQGVESCAFRARTLRIGERAHRVEEWALGVENHDRKAILFFETRVIDSAGTPLAIERPTLYMFGSGPTYDWRVGRSNRDGYVRVEKDLAATSARERLGFTTAVEDRGIKRLAITLPEGRGDAYIVLTDGATPRQFGQFAACVCDLLDNNTHDLFRCP